MEVLPHLNKEPANEQEWFVALIALARYLRGPEGCPWDRKQKSTDFARFAGEESAEFLHALEYSDAAHAAEEFGDAFFILLAAAAAAEEEGVFRLEDALRSAHEKMIRRHEHVFGAEKAQTPEEAIAAWEKIKQRERDEKGKK